MNPNDYIDFVASKLSENGARVEPKDHLGKFLIRDKPDRVYDIEIFSFVPDCFLPVHQNAHFEWGVYRRVKLPIDAVTADDLAKPMQDSGVVGYFERSFGLPAQMKIPYYRMETTDFKTVTKVEGTPPECIGVGTDLENAIEIAVAQCCKK